MNYILKNISFLFQNVYYAVQNKKVYRLLFVLSIIVLSANGQRETALQFDGKQNCILIPNNFNLIGDRTFSFWVQKSESQNLYQVLLYKSNVFAVSLNYGSGKLCVQWGNGKKWHTKFESNSVLPQDEWCHITVSKDQSTRISSIYFNGELDAKISIPNQGGVNKSPVFIGAMIESGKLLNHFQGKLSDLQIWNKTFNDAYLHQTNLSSVDLTENGLVGYYQLNNQSTETKHRSCKIAKSEFEGHDGILFHGNLNTQKENKRNVKNDEDCGFGENKKQEDLQFQNSENQSIGAIVEPTVTKDNFNLKLLKDKANFYTMSVANVMGEPILASDYFIGQQGQEFGQDLSPGVYFVDVRKGEEIQRIKVLKQE